MQQHATIEEFKQAARKIMFPEDFQVQVMTDGFTAGAMNLKKWLADMGASAE